MSIIFALDAAVCGGVKKFMHSPPEPPHTALWTHSAVGAAVSKDEG